MSYEPPAAPPVYSAPSNEPIPLWAPYYGATFGIAVKRFFTKYADFTGRASRSEYWWTMLAIQIVALVLTGAGLALIIPSAIAQSEAARQGYETSSVAPGIGFVVFSILFFIVWAGVLVPTLALTWRRLHDTNRSGGFFFLSFIPYVGGIIVLVFTILGPDPAGVRFDQPR